MKKITENPEHPHPQTDIQHCGVFSQRLLRPPVTQTARGDPSTFITTNSRFALGLMTSSEAELNQSPSFKAALAEADSFNLLMRGNSLILYQITAIFDVKCQARVLSELLLVTEDPSFICNVLH